jgi:hypothetical protein
VKNKVVLPFLYCPVVEDLKSPAFSGIKVRDDG